MCKAYTQGILYSGYSPNVAGGEKSSLNQDSNPGPLAHHASALIIELLRFDILSDFHPTGYPMTCRNKKKAIHKIILYTIQYNIFISIRMGPRGA